MTDDDLREEGIGPNGPLTIPKVDEVRMTELIDQIKPVVRYEEGLREIAHVDPRTVAFTWNPKPVGKALDLVEVGRVITYHNWGYYGLFKPSIVEVLAQLDRTFPRDFVNLLEFFELPKDSLVKQPLLHKPDRDNIDGYHKAEVILYRRK